jgi:hypothetical protein
MMRDKPDVNALMSDGIAVDRAVEAAYYEAVRRHRAAGVPMAMWEDGEVRMVSAFDIRLPEEQLSDCSAGSRTVDALPVVTDES